MLARALCHIDNAYWIPHVRVNGRIAKTNKTSQTAFRGFGGPAGHDRHRGHPRPVRPLLGIDADELRRRNFYREGRATPYGQPVRHPERLVTPGTRSATTADVDAPRAEIARFNAAHEHTKRGLAMTPVKFGISFNLTAFNQAGALVHVYKDGSVLDQPRRHRDGPGPAHQDAPGGRDHARGPARSGAAGADPHRQGAQHLGHGGELGRRPQRRRGQERLRADPTARRGAGAGSAPRPTSVEDGGEDASCGRRTFHRVQLWAAGYYRTEGLALGLDGDAGEPFKYFAYGVAAAEVEVDGFTGAYRTRRVDIVHDVGDSLSPLVDIGQIEGGFVQGAGWLTLEDLRWDESDGRFAGRLLTQAASTYKLPSFSEMPEDFHVSPAGARPRGRRGLRVQGRRRAAAHAGVLGPRGAARRRAAFGPAGISVDLASPATPEAVYWAVEQAAAATSTDHVEGGLPGRVPDQPEPAAHAAAPPRSPRSEQHPRRPAR